MSENKVKYNLKNAHYAVITEAEGVVTFGTPVALPGSVSISLSAKGDINKFYADGMVYYQTASNNGYEGDLELAIVPNSFKKDVLAETEDTNKVLVENANAMQKSFALLFEFDGDVKATRHVLYNCNATRPSLESKTIEDKKDVGTDKLSISAVPLADGTVKASTTGGTTEGSYTAWYKTVYTTPKQV